jgi:hypothetical protein
MDLLLVSTIFKSRWNLQGIEFKEIQVGSQSENKNTLPFVVLFLLYLRTLSSNTIPSCG